MRAAPIRRIAFASTGSIYGEAATFPTPEDAPFPIQTMLGERYSHGHVFDFYKQLRANPYALRVLGDGRQRKSYLYVQDCIDAMLLAIEKAHGNVNIFNLGTDEYCEVNDSVRWITEHLGVKPRLTYTGGDRGWIGDNPFIFLDCSKIRALGWTPRLSIQQGIIRTLVSLQENPGCLRRDREGLRVRPHAPGDRDRRLPCGMRTPGHRGWTLTRRQSAPCGRGRPLQSEPELDELLRRGLAHGRLPFSTDVTDAVRKVELVWVRTGPSPSHTQAHRGAATIRHIHPASNRAQ